MPKSTKTARADTLKTSRPAWPSAREVGNLPPELCQVIQRALDDATHFARAGPDDSGRAIVECRGRLGRRGLYTATKPWRREHPKNK